MPTLIIMTTSLTTPTNLENYLLSVKRFHQRQTGAKTIPMYPRKKRETRRAVMIWFVMSGTIEEE
jgi:hypothetical protein